MRKIVILLASAGMAAACSRQPKPESPLGRDLKLEMIGATKMSNANYLWSAKSLQGPLIFLEFGTRLGVHERPQPDKPECLEENIPQFGFNALLWEIV